MFLCLLLTHYHKTDTTRAAANVLDVACAVMLHDELSVPVTTSFGLDFMLCECNVIQVRESMGLTNLVVMVPFCRTVDEAKKVVAEMEKNGLTQEDGLKIYGM